MIRITDKSFRYTPSYNTDLKKTFKKMERVARIAAAGSRPAESARPNPAVPTIAWRGSTKS